MTGDYQRAGALATQAWPPVSTEPPSENDFRYCEALFGSRHVPGRPVGTDEAAAPCAARWGVCAMKAAVLRNVGRLDIEDLDVDGPRAEEVRIRVLASGLCHTDYHFITGDLPMMKPALLGHEAAGVIEAVGEDVRGLAPGDFVATCITAY